MERARMEKSAYERERRGKVREIAVPVRGKECGAHARASRAGLDEDEEADLTYEPRVRPPPGWAEPE